MKQYIIGLLVLLLTFSGSLCFAQTDQPTIKDDFKPSTLNQPGQEYPQVNSQGYARFRILDWVDAGVLPLRKLQIVHG